MSVVPTQIERVGEKTIRIHWSDEVVREYTVKALRDGCPCATCREKEKAAVAAPAPLLNVLSDAEMVPLSILGMKPVGAYAYSINFSDGHNTGIYTFEHLRELGEEVQ